MTIHIMLGGKRMENLLRKDKILNAAAILLVLGFIIRVAADYYKYQNDIINSEPFSLFVFARSIEFLLPGIICLIIARYLKKSSPIK